jgi:hypothetical protein
VFKMEFAPGKIAAWPLKVWNIAGRAAGKRHPVRPVARPAPFTAAFPDDVDFDLRRRRVRLLSVSTGIASLGAGPTAMLAPR